MNTPGPPIHQSINILAFDTSGDEASLALWARGKIWRASLPPGTGPHSQAACLVPAMQELLAKEALDFQDIGVVATPIGPGSFTGIRVGLATAQGLLLSTKARSFAPTTLHLFAFGAWKEGTGPASTLEPSSAPPCLVSLSTKRDSFYTQAFEKGCHPLGPARIQTEAEIQEFLALNPAMRRVCHLSISSAESLIHFYFYNQGGAHALLPEAQGTLRPCYVHNPSFARQEPCSL